MSMSTNIIGFRPPDDKWKAMKGVWDACAAAKTEPPALVDRFFDGIPPDPHGIEIDIEELDCCKEWRDEMRQGFEIEISKLPAHITHIRFYNSW